MQLRNVVGEVEARRRASSDQPLIAIDGGGYKKCIDGGGYKKCMTVPKLPLHLITPQFLEGMAMVLRAGEESYGPHNWTRGMSWETVMAAASRHMLAFRKGEELDPETGLSHLYHAACSMMFLAWYTQGPSAEAHKVFDDRHFTQPVIGTPIGREP